MTSSPVTAQSGKTNGYGANFCLRLTGGRQFGALVYHEIEGLHLMKKTSFPLFPSSERIVP